MQSKEPLITELKFRDVQSILLAAGADDGPIIAQAPVRRDGYRYCKNLHAKDSCSRYVVLPLTIANLSMNPNYEC